VTAIGLARGNRHAIAIGTPDAAKPHKSLREKPRSQQAPPLETVNQEEFPRPAERQYLRAKGWITAAAARSKLPELETESCR